MESSKMKKAEDLFFVALSYDVGRTSMRSLVS